MVSGKNDQIGINGCLRYVQFEATDTENDVYTYIAGSFGNMTNAVVRVGCIGNRWRNELTSFTVTSTSVAFTHNGNQTCYTARKGSSEKIGYPLVLFYVNSPRGSDA